MANKKECPVCLGEGQISYFGGVSRFAITYEECHYCGGFGFVMAEDELVAEKDCWEKDNMDILCERKAEIIRETKETGIELFLQIDGSGEADINTGVGFMNHMLSLFAVHGFFDLRVNARGDVEVDDHHTVEDLGICLGQAVNQALGSKRGICRYGMAYVPMDETLVRVCLDLSNRPFLHYNVEIADQKVGTFDTALAKEFLRAFAQHAGITLHVDLLHGENSHHIIEAVFKAMARALAEAAARKEGLQGELSSKGVL